MKCLPNRTRAHQALSSFLVILQVVIAPGLLPARATSEDQSKSYHLLDLPRMKVNRTQPIFRPFTGLPEFSLTPTDTEVFDSHCFEEPLVPVDTSSAAENRALVQAIRVYLHDKDRTKVAPLIQFLNQHPRTVWRAGLLINLGIVYRQTGSYTRALNAWSEAWNLSKGATEVKAHSMAERAGIEFARLSASLGRLEVLKPLLAELETP